MTIIRVYRADTECAEIEETTRNKGEIPNESEQESS